MIKRRRTRKLAVDEAKLVARALRFVEDDEQAREREMDARAQRYAKFRQWSEVTDSPWDDASNVAMPDLATMSLRMQDTLHNAVMALRPAMVSRAVHPKDRDRQAAIDQLTDVQLLVEAGQVWLTDAIDAFVNDGHFTVFVPWVREQREQFMVRTLGPLPPEELPGPYFMAVLRQEFPDAGATPRGERFESTWDFELAPADGGPSFRVSFYTNSEDEVEMVSERLATVFDGPRPICVDRADVLHPAGAANLQIPSPSNPRGAAHVILRDRPTADEVRRLVESGYYDSIPKREAEELLGRDWQAEDTPEDEQKNIIQGEVAALGREPEEHRRITRLVVFDIVDVDGDGQTEDVVYWVAKEPKRLLRVRRLAEAFPADKPRRPFAEAQYVPVRNRRTGIGVLELAESMHDARKQVLDMAINHGTLMLTPWGFYRPLSSIKPEVIRLFPGELYPLTDPSRDVSFPALPPAGQAFAANMLTILDREMERVEMIGDLQLGRVPQGKASALRTVRGMAMVTGQAEERPERILRRFFSGLAQVWELAHGLNRRYLPPERVVRMADVSSPEQNPYMEVQRDAVDVPVEFEFQANIWNTSRTAMQETLTQLAQVYLSELGFVTGVCSPKTVYQLFRNLAKAYGLDPDEYLEKPMGMDYVTWEEALGRILNYMAPHGFPAEGPMVHLTKMEQFRLSPDLGRFDGEQLQLYAAWGKYVQGLAVQAAQRQALGQAAGGGRRREEPQGQGRGQAPGPESQAPVQENELLDESLPTAGGGANVGKG